MAMDKEKAENEYDPHENRNLERANSNFNTYVHLIKGAMGAGVLSLPQAISHSGYLVGVIGILLITLILTYCMNLFVKCTYIVCKEKQISTVSYADSIKFGIKRGPEWLRDAAAPFKYTVDMFFIIFQLGVCCVYVIFIAENIKQVVDQYAVLDVRIWKCIVIVPLLLLEMIPDLKRLAPLSLVGNILILIALCIILHFVFVDLPPLKERDVVVNIKRLPLFVGIALFAISPITVVLAIENSMKTPKSFYIVFTSAMIQLGLLCAIFGFLGYWKYGDEAKGSVTLNIPQDTWFAHTVRILYSTSILFSYPLYAYIFIDLIWNQNLKMKFEESPRQTLYEYLIRIFVVIGTGLIAIAVPDLGLFISLIGVFCLSTLGFIFPAILDYCVNWPDKLGYCKWIVIKDTFLIIFGIVAFACGTFTSIKDIILAYQRLD